MKMRPDSYSPVSEKALYEIEVIFSKEDKELHLVFDTGEEVALARFLKSFRPEKPVAGYRANKCVRYATVTIGHRSY